MSDISAKMVAELRSQTGIGMMECKKALIEAQGDMQAAVELLRVKSGNKANKVAGRVAAEGMVASFITEDHKSGSLVEVNCETDFGAKNEDFMTFVQKVAETIARHHPADVDQLANIQLVSGETIEQAREAVVGRMGENITIRRFVHYETKDCLASYLHNNRIGVLIDLAGNDKVLGKDIAMHIVACKPVCLSSNDLPENLLEAERRIYKAQASESGKPAAIIDKMVEGRIKKYLSEVTLLEQSFVKNPDQSIADLLKEKKSQVNAFALFVLGEGIEKQQVDFAAEVAATAKGF